MVETFDEVTHDSIDINGNVDFFYFNNKYYALNINLLERAYGLEQVTKQFSGKMQPLI
ncbi:DUF4868 domain-containing protein [Klebsiella variicola subsp. variicola]|nr:DUF4868 domain-containing protein [Klebsiella variicola subsp. variicola]